MFPDCSRTSQTQATCSCVNPNEAMLVAAAEVAAAAEVNPEVKPEVRVELEVGGETPLITPLSRLDEAAEAE